MNPIFESGSLVAKAVTGRYKRAGRPGAEISVEVSAHVAMPDSRGHIVPYLFGTRLDGNAAGSVVLLRAGCFKPDSVKIEDAVQFKPVEGLAEGEWYVTPPSDANASFAFIERVTDPEDREWAETLGTKPLAQFVVEA